MARTPIRDVIERALEKGVGLENLVAVPMLFNAADQAEKESGMLKTEGGLYVPIDHVSVRLVWYQEKSIEIELSNGMNVSIETVPLTLKMRMRANTDIEPRGFAQVQLIRHDEYDSAAYRVEDRLRSLRQFYAIATLAYGYAGDSPLDNVHYSPRGTDIEEALDLDDRLLLYSAGQGSLWVTVGIKAVAWAKAAPKNAFVALTTIFEGGPERIVRLSEALVSEKEGTAREAKAKGRLAEAQALKAEAEAEASRAAASQAHAREALETERQRFALSREKILTYIDVRERVTEFKGAEPRATMLAELDKSVTNLLGETGEELIKLPPSPPKLP
jgi:hypothetical protein